MIWSFGYAGSLALIPGKSEALSEGIFSKVYQMSAANLNAAVAKFEHYKQAGGRYPGTVDV